MNAAARPRSFASFSAAPCIWLAHFVSVYALTSLGCEISVHAGDASGSLNTSIVTVLTLMGLGASGYAIYIQYREWRGRPSNTHAPDIFVAKTNVLLHALALVGMIWVAVPAFMLASCDV